MLATPGAYDKVAGHFSFEGKQMSEKAIPAGVGKGGITLKVVGTCLKKMVPPP